ncbi:MerR family transcriptional regulator [Nonomuraea sp. NPDC050404]|uniref:MerR family transcriptional regulator n=1 Tax=Nonomuraea sp. NPDC050404 TaxID=3155783 RepID=UPI0033FAF16E
MRIGELVRRTGVSERLLRYYEEQGLLCPSRHPGSGYREYTDSHVDAVRRIRSLLAAGLGTSAIAAVLPCLETDGERLAPTCPDVLGQLRAERDRIDRAMRNLSESRDALDLVITAAGR